LTSDELAGRDVVEDKVNDFLKTYMPNHAPREPSPQQDTEARSVPDGTPETVARDANTMDLIKAYLNSRGSSRDELAGRDVVEDKVNDFLKTYMPNHATREPSTQQDKALLNSRGSSRDELAGRDDPQARGIPDGPTKTDGSATDAFIHALMSSRDTSKEITADDMLTLASLASRALDELD